MHLLTNRMDNVNLFNKCLESDKEVDDLFEMLYSEH